MQSLSTLPSSAPAGLEVPAKTRGIPLQSAPPPPRGIPLQSGPRHKAVPGNGDNSFSISVLGCFKNDPAIPPDSSWIDMPPEKFDQPLPEGIFTGKSAPAGKTATEMPPVLSSHKPVEETSSRTKSRRISLPSDDVPKVGTIVDKYRLDELLGKGGFAAVYRATHLLLRRTVAIKLLLPKVVRVQPALADLLCEEARFTALINHPNVVRVIDVTHEKQITYIVMEYVDGMSLAATQEQRKLLSPREIVRIGINVCMGLKAALQQGLIHRDIKPANILLTRSGQVKIVDLGLARPSMMTPSNAKAPGAASLPENSVVGTPAYMAPEQAVSPEKADFRSDIYSLGATLYHAALGQPPFKADSNIGLIYKHSNEPVPHPETLVPDFPPDLSRLILWMMSKNPLDRPTSYDQLIEAMNNALIVSATSGGRKPERNTTTLFSKIKNIFG